MPAEQTFCRQVLLWWGSCTDPVSAALLRCWCLSGPNASLLSPPLSSCILFLPMGCTLHCFSPPLSPNPSEYLYRAVLLSPHEDMVCFLLLFHFFPSLHGQFNHIHETSAVFHLGAEIILPETAEKPIKLCVCLAVTKAIFARR